MYGEGFGGMLAEIFVPHGSLTSFTPCLAHTMILQPRDYCHADERNGNSTLRRYSSYHSPPALIYVESDFLSSLSSSPHQTFQPAIGTY